MEAPPAAPAGPLAVRSPLLRCLSQLNDDVLTAHLLPKLLEQESAGAVVLTCSQLRRLFQPSIQHLDLTKQHPDADNPCCSPELARQLVAAFPNCTSLDIAWAGGRMLSVYRNVSPLLAGLPHLSTISIKLDENSWEYDLNPAHALAQMQLHATGLRCFSLQLDTSWASNDLSWACLGKMASLTKLQLTFDEQVDQPCTQPDLAPLTGLSKLQSLCIHAPETRWWEYEHDWDAGPQVAADQFPGRLLYLTELHLPLEILVNDFSGVSDCVGLRDLQLRVSGGTLFPQNVEQWVAREHDALVQLTSLTRLHVESERSSPVAGVFYSVRRQLKGLRVVGAYTWVDSFLPVLRSLTKVTAVYGAWELDDGLDVSALVCPHIREGDLYGDVVPFPAFPNLACLSLYRAHGLGTLSSCWTGLQRLTLCEKPTVADTHTGSMLIENDDAARSLAMKSLAHLRCLTHLELSLAGDAQLVAFTSEAAAVGTLRLRHLHVQGELSLFALMQLQPAHGVHVLEELSVIMSAHPMARQSFSVEAVRALLVSLAVVPKVSLVLYSEEQRSVVEAARQWAAQLQLPWPAVLKVSVAPLAGNTLLGFQPV